MLFEKLQHCLQASHRSSLTFLWFLSNISLYFGFEIVAEPALKRHELVVWVKCIENSWWMKSPWGYSRNVTCVAGSGTSWRIPTKSSCAGACATVTLRLFGGAQRAWTTEHLKIAIHQLSSTFYESIPVSGCRNDPLHSGFVVGCFYEWLPGTRIRLPMLLTALRLLCCGLVVHVAPSVKPFQFLSSVSDFVIVSCRNAACFQVCSCCFYFSMSFQSRLLSSEVTTKQHIFANLKDLWFPVIQGEACWWRPR